VLIGRHLRIALLSLAIFLVLAGAAVAAQRADLAPSVASGSPPAQASTPAQAPPIRPEVVVTKTADPTTVPETGGDVTYTVTITNAGVEAFTLASITDDVGDAGPVTLTDLAPAPPASLDPAAAYTGTFARHVAGDAPGSLTNVVEVTASDGDGDTGLASADATVTFTDVLPQISVTKTADPTTVPESGDVVAFTVSIVNLSGEPVTLMSLTDTHFSLDALLPGWVGTVLTPYDGVAGGSDTLEGTFVQWGEGDASGPDHVNTVTAEAWDDEGNPAGASDDATVAFTDVLPQISVTKTANPTAVPEKGADVTYAVTITNDGAEAVTLGAITDKVGDADPATLTDLDPVPPASLDPGAVYTGTFTRRVAGEFPGSLTDLVEVAASDDDGNPTSAGDDATVTFTETPLPYLPQRAGGSDFALLIKPDGSLWSWGENTYGQLGLGDTATIHVVASRVGDKTDWTAVACGDYHSLAVKADGSLWSWGANSFGQLGLGDTDARTTPAQVGTDNDWIAVAGGDRHSMALKSDGSLWAWGVNGYGQLGVGDTVTRLTPTRVGTDADWASVSCGAEYTVALKTDGSLQAWGKNLRSQLGLGDTASRLSPTPVGSDTDWAVVSCGDEDCRALKTDGSLWAWGYNNFGQLGFGDTTIRDVPTPVGTDTDWAEVACGDDHTLAIKTDGSLWSWGANSFGNLGTGDTLAYWSPMHIGSDTDWSHVSCGDDDSAAFKPDRGLWTWGSNLWAQLGFGDQVHRNVPTFVFFTDDATPPPMAELTSPTHPDPDAWYSDSAPSFAWSATDASNIAGYKWVLDQNPAGEASIGYPYPDTSKAYTGLTDGVRYFHVRAVDRAGNWGPTSTRAVRIDTGAPATTDHADGKVHQYFVLELTPADALSGVAQTQYRVDGGLWKTGTTVNLRVARSPKRSSLVAGTHIVEYQSADAAGNAEDVKSCQVKLDWLNVHVSTPNGGESVAQDGETDVTWSLSRTVDTGSFDVWSSGAGASWTKINFAAIAVVPDQTEYSYHWYLADTPADDYRVRVTYSDGGDPVASDESDGAFSVAAVPQDASAKEIVALADHAYVAAGAAGLQIYDIGDPASPVLLGTCDTRGVARDVSVAGDYAYVADGAAGLEVVDVSDPAAPHLLSNLALPAPAGRLALSTGRPLEGFEDLTGWATTAGSLSVDGDHVKQGESSLRVTVPPSTSARVNKGELGWDVSGDTDGIELWVYLRSVDKPVPSGDGSLSLRIYASNASGNLSNAFYTGSNFTAHEGWNLLRFSPGDWKTVGTPSWEVPIQRIALDVATPADRSYEVSFDDLRVGVTGVKPAFIWSFDDGYDQTYQEVFPYLSSVGQRATLYVRTRWVDSGGSKITLAHLQELYDAGWAIGNHTMDHIDLTTVDQATAREQIQGGYDWLVAHGLTRAARHLAYPLNATNDEVVAAAREAGMLSARGAGNRNQQLPVDDAMRLASFGFDDGTPTLALWQTRIDRAMAGGSTLVAYAHALDATTMPVFEDIVDYLVAQGVWCPTIDEWWDTLAAQSESGESVAGHYVYVACGDAGVQVVDIGDPLAPALVGTVDTASVARDVAVSGALVSTADETGGLQVVDATSPDAPVVIGGSPAVTGSVGAFAKGDLTFLAEGTDGLRIVSLADPSAPVTLGSCDTPGDARDVVVIGTLAYVADGAEGVQIVDVADLGLPVIAGAVPVTGEADALVVFGGRAYVATGDGGLQIVPVAIP
jgi:alpha-tubulin suppressor-like RCC1 family protein/peptidoglycan/xylan/chitin deacetylase (PgdA/CDA1 family)